MPENWEIHKEVIEELYIKQGYTLERLRKTMISKYGVTASPRTYKNKLDEWDMRKNRRKKKLHIREEHSRAALPLLIDDELDIGSTPSSPSGESWLSPNFVDSGSTSTFSSPSVHLEIYRQPFQLETVPLTLPNGVQFQGRTPRDTHIDPNDLGPIVNSSLMFFSFRTDSKNLQILAKFPTMAPRAIEILLRNWKPGGEYMYYAFRFLQEAAYCRTLLSVNWTRWTHQDETLFDLIDVYVPEDEQVALTRAILDADIIFQYPLEPLHASWASRWRFALQQTEWKDAEACLTKLGAHSRLRTCALAAVANFYRKSEETHTYPKELLGIELPIS